MATSGSEPGFLVPCLVWSLGASQKIEIYRMTLAHQFFHCDVSSGVHVDACLYPHTGLWYAPSLSQVSTFPAWRADGTWPWQTAVLATPSNPFPVLYSALGDSLSYSQYMELCGKTPLTATPTLLTGVLLGSALQCCNSANSKAPGWKSQVCLL